jgi:REP element-mobilizing transposase RayT
MNNKLPVRKRIHLKEFDYSGSGYIYFVTICTKNKVNHFSDSKIADIISNELDERVKMKEIILYCYCIMPDHLHLLLSLSENYRKKLQNWISAFKRFTVKIVKDKFGITDLWQVNFYERILRQEESIETVGNYIISNPVRKGIVDNWTEYKYSKICI